MQQAATLNFSDLPRSFQAILSALENGIDQIEKTNYPPHNIYRTGEDDFYIEIAAAGFSSDEIDISVEKSELKITGTKSEGEDNEDRAFLHRGIALRNFRRTYRLGEYVVVRDARMQDGVLTIHLLRELPEEAKPRKIEINAGA
jgi:molecular chaperone IbpA